MSSSPLPLLSRLPRRLRWPVARLLNRATGRDAVSGLPIHAGAIPLTRIGSTYGGWIVPPGLLRPDSVCYCAGVGEDITFDLGLIDLVGCHVHAFDPTPRARAWVARTAADNPRFTLHPWGLWDTDEVRRFYAPRDSRNVSHSIVNLQKTEDFFEAPCRRLKSVLGELGHHRIDLLKLDIEGAEYRVLSSMLDDSIPVGILCVEYDEAWSPLDRSALARIADSVRNLDRAGLALVAVEQRCNYTFVRRELLRQGSPGPHP